MTERRNFIRITQNLQQLAEEAPLSSPYRLVLDLVCRMGADLQQLPHPHRDDMQDFEDLCCAVCGEVVGRFCEPQQARPGRCPLDAATAD